MKKIIMLTSVLTVLQSLHCNTSLDLQLSVHWQSPISSPQDVTMNQMLFSQYGYGGSGDKRNGDDYYTTQHILGSYWAASTPRAYFSRPKNSSFQAWYGDSYTISSVRARRTLITSWAAGGCEVFGPADATGVEGVFCYEWLGGADAKTDISANKNIFGALRGQMQLSLANFNPLPGVTTMNTSDYFPGGVYVPLHFVTPGTYVVLTKDNWSLKSSINNDLNGVISKQNNYAAIYDNGSAVENASVKASDDIGF